MMLYESFLDLAGSEAKSTVDLEKNISVQIRMDVMIHHTRHTRRLTHANCTHDI